MKDPNRVITVGDVSKPGGVQLANHFGDQGDPIFNQSINEIPVTFKTIL